MAKAWICLHLMKFTCCSSQPNPPNPALRLGINDDIHTKSFPKLISISFKSKAGPAAHRSILEWLTDSVGMKGCVAVRCRAERKKITGCTAGKDYQTLDTHTNPSGQSACVCARVGGMWCAVQTLLLHGIPNHVYRWYGTVGLWTAQSTRLMVKAHAKGRKFKLG